MFIKSSNNNKKSEKSHAEYSRELAKHKKIELLNNKREEFILNFKKNFRQLIYDTITNVSNNGKTSFTLKRDKILAVATYHFLTIHPNWDRNVYISVIACFFGIGFFTLPFSPFALFFLSPHDYECQTHTDIEFAKRLLAMEKEEIDSIQNDGYKIIIKFNKYKIKW